MNYLTKRPSIGITLGELIFLIFILSQSAFAQECSFGGTTIACLQINNDQNIERTDEVAFSSIPLARSINLLNIDNLQIRDNNGTIIPAQFNVIARWGGTVDNVTLPIRWLEVLTQDTHANNSIQNYSLHNLTSTPAPIVNPLTVNENNGIYTVNTGAAIFTINSQNNALLDRVMIGGNPIYQHTPGAGPALTINSGQLTLDTSTVGQVVIDPQTFEVIENGPLKTSFAVQAHFIDTQNQLTLCDDFTPNIPAYESMGYTVIMSMTRGTGHLDMQVNFRNECIDAMFQPFTTGVNTFDLMEWNFPLNFTATNRFYSSSAAVASTNMNIRVAQMKGAGNPWQRRASVNLNGTVTENSEALANPMVAASSGQNTAMAQMPWMRFREPQALRANNNNISLQFIGEPLAVGGGKGLFNFARVSFLSGVNQAAQLETIRNTNQAALERGLTPRASLEDTNRSMVFPSLGNNNPSLLKSEYENFITQFHNETVGPGGQHELAKTYGSQLWPDTQGFSWPNVENVIGPTDNPRGINYWSTNRVELIEYFRTGNPLWVWDLSLPLTWQQIFSAYVNKGENVDNFKNGLNLTSPLCTGPNFLCEEGQWYRYGGGSDDYGYTWGNLGYVIRPNYALKRRFAIAGNTVVNRYNIPRAMQQLREETVSQVDLRRQVIQHFVQLANCAEFVPGVEGQACHNRLIEVVTELAEENMSTGLMCQADIQPANPSLCMPIGGDTSLNWCDCVTPQQFINNSLISPFLHRMLLNYGDLGGSLAFGLSMNSWHVYRSAIGIPEAQRPIDPTDPARPAIDSLSDWLNQPGWDQDVTPFIVQDVSVIDDDPFTTDPGTIIDENLVLDPNKPHTAVQFLLAHSINPSLNLCNVAANALNDQFMLDAWDDYQNLGGWLKGPAEIMQGMAFGIGVFDDCAAGIGNSPTVNITNPTDGSNIELGTPIQLQANANDTEDGDLSANVSWSSSIDGNLGTGNSISATLSEGQHTITASVSDSDNQTGSSSVNISVSSMGGCTTGLILNEDFESGLNAWSTTGMWHLVSNSTCGVPGFSSAVSSVYFGQDIDCDYDTGSQEMGALISPIIDNIVGTSVLSFSEFRAVEFEPSATVDQTEVAARIVGTTDWMVLDNRNSQQESTASWEGFSNISLSAYAGQSIQIRFLFDSDDEQFNDFTGWMIDDVQVTGCLTENDIIFTNSFEN